LKELSERGEPVAPESLDRIAEALGYSAGDFTSPRCRISSKEAATKFEDTYGSMELVKVAPLHTQRQVRAAVHCHAYFPHCPELPEEFQDQVKGLVEWLDFTAFELSDFKAPSDETMHRRKLYNEILAYVRSMER
jgi:hypothetical protein